MQVIDILRRKGDRVATIDPAATIDAVVRRLAEEAVGALVVTDEQAAVIGIISERDVVRRLHRDGPSTLEQSVADLMTREVVTCAPADTVAELMELMTERRIRHLPVVVDGDLGGVVSIGDVVKSRLTELEEERRQLEEYITTGR